MVDRQVAGQQRALVEVAEQQVAVGDGRLGAAAAVADGARLGARALGPDAQGAGAVHPGDGAAAGRDLGEIDHRHADRVAGAVHPAVAAGAAADLVLGRRLVLAVADQARLGGGAAHVEGEQVARPICRATRAAATTPAAGPDSTAIAGMATASAASRTPPLEAIT